MSSYHPDTESEVESENENFKIITTEIAYFKSSLADIKDTVSLHSSVVQELLEFSDKRKTPVSSKIPIISHLKEVIKGEILEDVLRQFSGSINKINLIEKQFDHFSNNQEFLHAEIEKDFSLLQTKASLHEEQIANINDGCAKLNNQLSNLTQEVNSKASVEDVCKLQDIVPTLALQTDMEELQRRADTFALNSVVEEIDKRLRKLQAQVNELPTMEFLHKKLYDLETNINQYIAKFAEKELLNSVADNFTDRLDGLEHRIESVKAKLIEEDVSLDKKIAMVRFNLESEPWQKDVKELNEIIDTKALQCDLVSFRELTFPKLEHFENRVSEFSGDIRKFEQALARFDEIILSKGSKHDLDIIKKKLRSFVENAEFSQHLEYLNMQIDRLNRFSDTSQESIEAIVTELDNYAITSKAQMKKNREISRLAQAVEEMKENLKIKAEKTETFFIGQTMATKDELNTLQNHYENLYGDFEQSLVLLTETLKTMLKSADAPVTKNKIRLELFNSATSLMNTHIGLRARALSKSSRNPNGSGRLQNLYVNQSSEAPEKPHQFLRSFLRKRKYQKHHLSLMTPELNKS